MSLVPMSFREFTTDCYLWSMYSDDSKKEIQCNLNGVDVKIILTRMVLTQSDQVKIPNRINVVSNDPRIQDIFNLFMWQPKSYPNWDDQLWVFRNDPNIGLPTLHYELRFFSSEELLNSKFDDENKVIIDEKFYSCTII